MGEGISPKSSPVLALLFALLLLVTLAGCGLGGTTTGSPSTGGSQPVLSLSQTSLAFGTVTTGSASTKSLTLRNTGTASLTISGVVISGSVFSVTGLNLPATISAGSSLSVSVVFAPKAGGSLTGSLTFASNSSSTPAPVALSGTGVAPTPQLSLSPTSVAFGSVTVGQTSTKQVTIRNSGTSDLHVSALTPSSAAYSVNGFVLPLTLAPSATAVGNVVFAPSATGTFSGSISVTSDSTSAVPPLALSGTAVAPAPQISVSPNSILFGNVTTGQSATYPLTLKNTGTAGLNVTAITPSGAGYSVNGFVLPLTLAPGASWAGNVVFKPASVGTVNGSVAIASNSSVAASAVSLSGTGVAPQTYQLSATPASLNFGTVSVGATSSLSVTLTNTGTGSVSVSAANVSGSGFSVAATLPITIAAGASRSVNVAFAPTAAGTANGSIGFVSNALNSPATVTLTGVAQTATPHTVDLAWNASTSSTVVGYHVYRSTQSGGPYSLLTPAVVNATAYTDTTVVSGTTYYYVVRSVDASGTESANSVEVSATIP